MAAEDTFRYDIEYSQLDPTQFQDSRGNKITTIVCHGRLVSETREKLEGVFQHTAFHGHIYFDLGDVSYLDSAGLGALIRLKVSAIREGVSLKFVQMGPRVMQLLRIAHLMEWIQS